MKPLLLSAFTAFALISPGRSDDPKPKPARFDHLVREEIFRGFDGDEEALARGIKACNDALKDNPKHATALVWRGAANLYQAGVLFQKGSVKDATTLWTAALKDMDDAVALEPKNIAVRIPRAASLLPAAREMPIERAKPLLAKALEDFQFTYDAQKNILDKLGTHPRGELHMGLAEVYRLTGDFEKSREQLNAIVKDMPDTKYSKRANDWLAAKPNAKLAHTCIGCHTKK
jgi:tetratricopeptide (TPR) repeat protein